MFNLYICIKLKKLSYVLKLLVKSSNNKRLLKKMVFKQFTHHFKMSLLFYVRISSNILVIYIILFKRLHESLLFQTSIISLN